MKKLIIYGASYVDIIKVISNIKKIEDMRVVGFLDDIKYGKENAFMGYPILGAREDIKKYKKDHYFVNNVFSTPQNRGTVFALISDCMWYSVIDPSVNLNYVDKGRGIFIGDRVYLGALVKLMDGVAIRGFSYIGHETILGKNVFIAPCACLLGKVTIGDNSFIGANSVIRNGITIGSNVTIGCGAVVVNDIPDNITVVGNPAKPTKYSNNEK